MYASVATNPSIAIKPYIRSPFPKDPAYLRNSTSVMRVGIASGRRRTHILAMYFSRRISYSRAVREPVAEAILMMSQLPERVWEELLWQMRDIAKNRG
ncbi:hypothetical protein SAMN05660880_00902 [Luteibacter sp. 22Crub2.1]|nr:hypothetical protein SAMN05660880_00902 [Luteibacter sp. 22Crub2.1]